MKYDGLIPAVRDTNGKIRMSGPAPREIDEILTWIAGNRKENGPFDIVVEGATSGSDRGEAASVVAPWQSAGATWWLEAMWSANNLDTVLARIRQGPPVSGS